MKAWRRPGEDTKMMVTIHITVLGKHQYLATIMYHLKSVKNAKIVKLVSTQEKVKAKKLPFENDGRNKYKWYNFY